MENLGEYKTIEQFKEELLAGWYDEYDGVGYYEINNKESNKPINLSEFMSGNIPEGVTHLIWYNK